MKKARRQANWLSTKHHREIIRLNQTGTGKFEMMKYEISDFISVVISDFSFHFRNFR